ncbi:MAG TPA: hypothetical protein VF614_16740, partial [Chthoniobacteraceae bacterium]
MAVLALIVGALGLYWAGSKEVEKEIASGVQTFRSEVATTPEGLKQHYVPFAFEYPAHFKIIPDDSYFVRVEEQVNGVARKSFAVGYLSAPADVNTEALYEVFMEQVSTNLAERFTGFRELSQTPGTVAGVVARSMAWQAEERGTPEGDVPLFGRTILCRPLNSAKGATLVLVANPRDP